MHGDKNTSCDINQCRYNENACVRDDRKLRAEREETVKGAL